MMKTRDIILTVLLFVAAILTLCVRINAAFDPEAAKTALSVVGAWWLTYAIMRVVLWLDTPRRPR